MNGLGRIVWIELMTTDPAGAKRFYSDLVGWSTSTMAGSDYEIWSMGGKQQGGMMKMPPELLERGVPVHWLGYVGVENVDRAVEKATRLGGTVKQPATDIPGKGRFAVVADPQGAVFGVFQGQDGLDALSQEDLGGLGWCELNTTDWKSAWKFYAELFGWEKAGSMDMGPEFGEYLMFGTKADAQMGGMSDMAKVMNLPPHWLYYVNVKNVDEVAARVPGLGGKVTNGPMDVPGGSRIINGLDPQGGAFALVSGGAK